ncbi:MAG: thiamine pyrophosphate-binding protein [Candidatus Omnitrophota bacterium]
MKLSDYIINYLVSKDVTHVFEVCGGSITHLLDSLYSRKDISVVSMHHEQAAAFAAEGFARSSGNIGVAMATSGPGATNLLTGIASCFFDSIPCVFITGQVNTYEFKFDKPVRQVGFQETDIVNLVKPITKYAVLVTDPKKIRYYLEKAFYIAKSGRPGPVLIDIPMNVQRADIDPGSLEVFHADKIIKKPDISQIKKVIGLVKSSSRPVVLIGGGLRLSKAHNELSKFIKHTGIPVVSSLMGIDGFSHDNSEFSGMIGTYGNRCANLTTANSDLLMILGARLDTRQTGTIPETFARGAKIFHVDIDMHELNNKRKVDLALHCDIKDFLGMLNKYMGKYDRSKIKPWKNIVASYKKKYSSYTTKGSAIHPDLFIHELSKYLPDSCVVSADVGQNQIWAAQALKIKKEQRFLTQGGAGAMGSSLSMAIGASFADPGRIVVSINGDGGFQLNIQELQTICHYKLPIKVILINNRCYGMVRQFQEQYFNSRFQSTVIGYSCPDFQRVVAAYCLPVQKISRGNEIAKALTRLFKDDRAMFLEIDISPKEKVSPKLSVNRPIEEQEPFLPLEELRSNMLIDLISSKDKK